MASSTLRKRCSVGKGTAKRDEDGNTSVGQVGNVYGTIRTRRERRLQTRAWREFPAWTRSELE